MIGAKSTNEALEHHAFSGMPPFPNQGRGGGLIEAQDAENLIRSDVVEITVLSECDRNVVTLSHSDSRRLSQVTTRSTSSGFEHLTVLTVG